MRNGLGDPGERSVKLVLEQTFRLGLTRGGRRGIWPCDAAAERRNSIGRPSEGVCFCAGLAICYVDRQSCPTKAADLHRSRDLHSD
jgi:hypothetical protein